MAPGAYGAKELHDLFAAPDWYPGEHPRMPDIVAHGRRGAPEVQACAYCHLPSGGGRPENASLAGLPYGYIVSQVADMKSGKRSSSVAGRVPTSLMVASAKAATEDEIAAAARYYSALPPRSSVQVVESDQAPRTIASGWVLSKDPAGGTEPIGTRIVEVPEDHARFELRDEHVRYVAYVPAGSVKLGEALVQSGGPGKTTPCGSCHGSDLKGTSLGPRLAGLSPTYLVRQLYDFKSGARGGSNASQMRAVAYNLTEADMVRVAAYLGSR